MCCFFCPTMRTTLPSKCKYFSIVLSCFKQAHFFLTSLQYLIPLCSYDEEADKVNQYQRLNLEGLEKIEIGKVLHPRVTLKS